MRPEFITDQQIITWEETIRQDPILLALPKEVIDLPIFKEVCYAGLWLGEELVKIQCPSSFITRIQWQAGKLSYGRDPWEVHQKLLQAYINNEMIFESDPDEPIN